MEDPYTILGVKRSATKQEVKAAYKQAVKECHPDRHINSPQAVQKQAVERFKRVKDAYEALGTGGHEQFQRSRPSGHSTAGGQQYYRQADWAYTRSSYTYRPNPKGYSSFAEWLFSTNRFRTPRVIRQQATLVVAAISGLILLDVASNTAWDMSNEGRLFKHIEQEASARLDRKLRQRASAPAANPNDHQPCEQEAASTTADESASKHTIVGQAPNSATTPVGTGDTNE